MSMCINVRQLGGAVTKLDAVAADCVSTLKDQLTEQLGISSFKMVLVKGRTPLLDDSATMASLDIEDGTVLTLIEKSYPEPTIKDSAKITALVEDDDVEGLSQAVMEGYDLNVIADPVDDMYYTLHQSIMKGNFEMMKLVLASGVSVFAITEGFPKSALQVAAKFGHVEICKWLVEYGLDPHEVNVMTSDGSNRRIESWPAWKYATERGHLELGAWLEAQPSPTSTYSVIA